MTRKQFVKRTFSPQGFVMCNFAKNSVPSDTDPSEALTGYQMFLAAQSGINLATKANYDYNNLGVDQLTPVDNPNADFFQKMEYAKSVEKDVRARHQKMQEEQPPVDSNN